MEEYNFKSAGSSSELKILLAVGSVALAVVLFLSPANAPASVAAHVPENSPSAASKSSQKAPPDYMVHPKQAGEYVRDLAIRTYGSYYALSPSDRKVVDSVTEGHGYEGMIELYRRYENAGHKRH